MFGNVNGECLSIFFGLLRLRGGCFLRLFNIVSRLVALNRRGLCRLIGLLISLRLLLLVRLLVVCRLLILLLDRRFLTVHILCRRLILIRGLHLIVSSIVLASLCPVLGIICVSRRLVVYVELCSAPLAETVTRHVVQTTVPTV